MRRAALLGGLLLASCGRVGLGPIDEELGCGADCGAADAPLVAAHRTPNSISWQWAPEVVPEALVSYVLWFGTDAGDVAARGGSARPWSVDEDPNLGWRWCPFGANLVTRTTVTGLEPDTEYVALLSGMLAAGEAVLVASGRGRTAPPASGSLTIFDEVLPPGTRQWIQPSLASVAHQGTQALWWNGDGAWTSARLMSLGLDLSALPADFWQRGYLELYIAIAEMDAKAYPIYYAEIDLGPDDTSASAYSYDAPDYVVLPNALGWHRLQVPLAALQRAGAPPDAASFGTTLNRLTIGFESPPYRDVYVDDIGLYY